MKRTMILITGPIGVGKSTFVKALYNKIQINDFELVSTDLYYYLYFRNLSESDNLNYKRAKEYCDYKMNKIMRKGDNILWETVVAKKDKIDILTKFKNNGYTIITIMLSLQDLNILNNRVLKRHFEGWYDIPETKIESRLDSVKKFYMSLKELSSVYIDVDASNLKESR